MSRVFFPSVLITAMMMTSSCGKTILQMMMGSSQGVSGLNAAPNGQGFTERCGFTLDQLNDPNFMILDQKLAANIEEDSPAGASVGFKIALLANIHAVVPSGPNAQSVTETIVSVTNVNADDDGRFSTAMANDGARKASSRVTSTGMSTGLLLQLQQSDPNFKNIQCAVGFTSQATTETVEGVGTVVYTPGIPLSVNPKSSASNLDFELGPSRSFTAHANVTASGKGWAPVGTQTDVTVTIKKVDPTTVAGMPASAPKTTANLAYEVTETSPLGDVQQIGGTRRTVYFIDSTRKSLVGVLSDSGKYDDNIKGPMAPVFAVSVSN